RCGSTASSRRAESSLGSGAGSGALPLSNSPAPIKRAGPPMDQPWPARPCKLFLVRQGEHRQHTAQLGVVFQRTVGTDRTQTLSPALQSGGHADTGPAPNPGQHGNVLLAVVHVGGHVADDPRWGLELVEQITGLGVDRLEI